jgi:mono/diheme cytochrome c family protein
MAEVTENSVLPIDGAKGVDTAGEARAEQKIVDKNVSALSRARFYFLFLLLVPLALVACDLRDTSQPQWGQTTDTGEWDAAVFYATTCASCHGPTGNGSSSVPSLNREAIRTADRDWLIDIISNGRPGTAMPAWSREYGGPLRGDQITELADLLQSGDWEQADDTAELPTSPSGPGIMRHGRGRDMMDGGMGNCCQR